MRQEAELFIAVDGGASKTDIVLFNKQGNVLKRVIGESTNINDVGFDQVSSTFDDLLEQLLSGFTGKKTYITMLYAGLSGGGSDDNRGKISLLLRTLLPNANGIVNGSDALNPLYSGIGNQSGMVLIAGTGSIVYVKCGDNTYQVGGWGYLLGDEGSGFDIGRNVLSAVLKAIDGRGEKTLMQDQVEEILGKSIITAIPEIYQKGKRYIAGFSPIAFSAAKKNDPVAMTILNNAAFELSRLIRAGSVYMTDADKIKVVLAGGVWKSGDIFLHKLKNFLNERYILIQPDMPPVYGAAIAAMKADGYDESTDFRKNFKEGICDKRQTEYSVTEHNSSILK